MEPLVFPMEPLVFPMEPPVFPMEPPVFRPAGGLRADLKVGPSIT
jgi:hypothetical protein